MNAQIKPIIQSLLFASPQPLLEDEIILAIKKAIPELEDETIHNALYELIYEFQNDQFGFEITKSGMGYSFVSKAKYYDYIVNYIETIQKRRLSKAALETLSIIAFQPDCTKMDIEIIRGVAADYAIDKLIERELICISGRKDTAGHPCTYRTTEKFLDYFGIQDVSELPKLTDLSIYDNEIGLENETPLMPKLLPEVLSDSQPEIDVEVSKDANLESENKEV